MATTARIASQEAAATYTVSLAAGATHVFGTEDLAPIEAITFLKKDSAGGYAPIRYMEVGVAMTAELTNVRNEITVKGPVDLRISKPITAVAVEVVEYT